MQTFKHVSAPPHAAFRPESGLAPPTTTVAYGQHEPLARLLPCLLPCRLPGAARLPGCPAARPAAPPEPDYSVYKTTTQTKEQNPAPPSDASLCRCATPPRGRGARPRPLSVQRAMPPRRATSAAGGGTPGPEPLPEPEPEPEPLPEHESFAALRRTRGGALGKVAQLGGLGLAFVTVRGAPPPAAAALRHRLAARVGAETALRCRSSARSR